MELVSLLEGNDRKLVGVEKGSVVLKVYCPTIEAGEQLKQLTEMNKLAESFTNFTKAAGQCAVVVHESRSGSDLVLSA